MKACSILSLVSVTFFRVEIRAILNRCHPIRPFVYGAARFVEEQIHVEVRPRKRSRGLCGGCGRRGPTYDTARESRLFEFVPVWGFAVFLVYAMRRIECAVCGVKTERVPWAEGKNQCCNVYRLFLARWARRLRRPAAKLLAVVQLLKSAFTFGDWLPYALWKLERHTGTRLTPTERQRRHPFLFGWPLMLRVLRRRDLR